jgi:NAD(P)-dependent dehydrogenase (short-subunit alcohol dehydrogenase family)
MPMEKVTSFGKNTPLKRPGQPAELAATYVLLASEASSYTTGALYEVTGGRPML